ncbi:MAG: sodium:solute symporter [Acidobacteria bacterium]|nr:sodium:solute symporter [Acidobacteriota bacterium]
MNLLDWAIIALYIVGLIVFSIFLSRGQKDTEDYFLGSRNLPWGAIAISTMATQLSAISFISAPAFVAVRPGGGLIWLGYEFAVPLAMIFVMIVILPFLHRNHIVSIYEYLEHRFDLGTRTLISLIFQISRALATGVGVYAIAIVFSVTVGMNLWVTILIIGVVAMIYDTLGGIKAVIYTDVVQMGILLIGILVCSGYALYYVGGWGEALAAVPAQRWQSIDWGHGFGDGADFGFWPLLVGGFFLYVSYYGCDQSQVQRELSARNEDDLKKSLFFNGIFRFPVVLGYCLMGLLIGSLLLQDSAFAAEVSQSAPDYLVPIFIMRYLPHGIIGMLAVAIFAAAMSSLDSALNSLSAASYKDIYERYFQPQNSHDALKVSKILTVFWGIFCTGFAFLVGSISGTVIEAINKIGSAFYGPILATFLLGIMTRTAVASAVKWGVLLGVGTNLIFWLALPQVSWLWWNVIGFAVTFGFGYGISSLLQKGELEPAPDDLTLVQGLPETSSKKNWKPAYVILGCYFVFMVMITYWIGTFAG